MRPLFVGLLLGLAACPSSPPPPTTGTHLWLATIDGNETHLQLSPIQPADF